MTTHGIPPLPTRAILSAEERAMLAAYVDEKIQQGQAPFALAAEITGLPAELLRKLVRDKVLDGWAPWRTEHVEGYCNIDQARTIAAQLAEARQSTEDKGILVTEAAGKYRFHRITIYGWIANEWVKKLGTAPNGDILVNEGDIAFARALADLSGQQRGKPVFPSKRKR